MTIITLIINFLSFSAYF